MHEKFLAYLWRNKRFDQKELTTTNGEPLEIIYPGDLNTHSGPDFSDARIRIGDTLWAGHVEIHVKASDWIRHRHTVDRAYDNTILHVVHEADLPITNTLGVEIPAFVLANRYDESLYAKFSDLVGNQHIIPCTAQLPDVPPIIWFSWLDRLLVQRLEQKTEAIQKGLKEANEHWDEAFYHALGRNFGQKVNAQPFEALVKSLPMQILAKHKTQLFQLEALLFGQAGMLEQQFQDAYPESLRKEYHYLKHKYSLQPLDAVQWKYFRMRPAGFPTIRIAQFAALVFQSSHLFSKVMESESVKTLEHLFKCEVSPYWKTHYRFDTEATKSTPKPITKDQVHLILYNTILPFWFLYGKARQLPDLQKKALDFYEALPPEQNQIITDWQEAGKKAQNAGQAQALIELRTQFCDKKRCTQCAVGVQILR
jgi:hypothetical protein